MQFKTAVCVLVEQDGKYLGVSRKDDKTDFGLPGGKLEAGETLIEAAVRETLEETGYDVLINAWNPYVSGDKTGNYITFTFKASLKSSTPSPISEEETGVVDFVTKEQLLQGSFKDYNEKMFNHFSRGLCDPTD